MNGVELFVCYQPASIKGDFEITLHEYRELTLKVAEYDCLGMYLFKSMCVPLNVSLFGCKQNP